VYVACSNNDKLNADRVPPVPSAILGSSNVVAASGTNGTESTASNVDKKVDVTVKHIVTIPEPDKFTKSTAMDVWIKQFEKYAAQFDKKEWNSLLMKHLDDHCRKVVDYVYAAEADYDELKEHLALVSESRTKVTNPLREFSNRVQLQGEPIYEYARVLEQLARDANLPEEQIKARVIEQFMDGLGDRRIKVELKKLFGREKDPNVLHVIREARRLEKCYEEADICNDQPVTVSAEKSRVSSKTESSDAYFVSEQLFADDEEDESCFVSTQNRAQRDMKKHFGQPQSRDNTPQRNELRYQGQQVKRDSQISLTKPNDTSVVNRTSVAQQPQATTSTLPQTTNDVKQQRNQPTSSSLNGNTSGRSTPGFS
jgi:uncharacterized protein Yka (UPF0111/DUF47 family)